ncbi:hypothetical protein Hte_012393 [Hypoxylon texense]
MASPPYGEILKDLYIQIHRKLERQDVADQRFAKVGTAEEVLAPFNLRRFFCSLVPQGDFLEQHFGPGITVDVLISRTEERCLQNFLAILIYSRCSGDSARGFVTKLLASSSSEWNEVNQLPASREQLEQVFGTQDGPDINTFMDTQSCFCPVVLYEGEDVQVADGRKQRLPYVLDPVYIDTGSYGIVYSVVIAKGHLANRHTHMANTEPMAMARKDFKKVHELHQEYEIMKSILRTPRKSKNIVETFGSLQLETTFSLFMPLAECDLRMWMRKNGPPIFESEKADILMCASGLADGLEFLHSEIRDSNGNRMVCYHMDLKPANILVFPDDRERGKMVWKISDFGMSRVKLSRRHAITDDKDISVLFEKRGGETTASGTVNRRFDATYLAPESSVAMPTMNEKSDVWSLGCVISVILTYLSEGQAGIEKYSEDRATASQRLGAGNMDRFFLIGRTLTHLKPHPAIKTHHKHLITDANGRSSEEGKIMVNILKYIEERILQLEPGSRVSAGSIRDTLFNVSADYQKLGERYDDPENYHPDGVSINAAPGWWQRLFNKQKQVYGPRVESWVVHDTQSPIGCSIAPNEFVMAYWTSTEISLYNSKSFVPYSGGRNINKIAKCGLRGTSALKSVKLTDQYLIASTTGHHSHILLFDLKIGGKSGLNFDRSYEVVLPSPSRNGLHQIAISPGSKVLACVVHQDVGKSWVFHANIQDLLTHGIRRRDSETTLSSTDGLQYRITAEEQWNGFTVDASAGSITHLLFTSDTTLCWVAQPDITERHQPHITLLSLPNRSVKTKHLDNSSDVEYDSGNWGRLFTTLTATDNEHTLAVVLYENQLVIRNFVEPNSRFRSETTFRNYFISELLMDEQHSRLFALGNKSGHGTLLLMELPLTHLSHREKPLEIKEFPRIGHRDKFAARLFRGTSPASDGVSGESGVTNAKDAEEEDYIIISVYTGSKPIIYKVNLPSTR